uniref:Uncharacterized protein n=1 Tax=Cannabis sativa TaxID=3483 RepID=A0A803QS08_CANSA
MVELSAAAFHNQRHPWYGDWGYEFGAGSFALSLDAYKASVESLSSLPLSIFSLRDKLDSHLQTLSHTTSLVQLRRACECAPPELLDYCLKELGGKMTPNGMVVNATRILILEILEFVLR